MYPPSSRTYFEFLSTPSGWRATSPLLEPSFIDLISIHALRVEGDESLCFKLRRGGRFLSTPSGWRATLIRSAIYFTLSISIHALRVEGDLCYPSSTRAYRDLVLSTPSGWRATTTPCHACFQLPVFLSTPSGWRATR